MVGQLLYFWEDLLFRCYVSFREGSHWCDLHEEQCRVSTYCQPYPRMSILLLRAAAPPICSNLYLGGLQWRPTDAHSHTVGRVWGACEESTWLEGYFYSALSKHFYLWGQRGQQGLAHHMTARRWANVLAGGAEDFVLCVAAGEARPVWTDELLFQFDWSDCRRPVCELHANRIGILPISANPVFLQMLSSVSCQGDSGLFWG